MNKVTIYSNSSYNVFIGENILHNLCLVSDICNNKVLIISDDVVWKLHNKKLLQTLTNKVKNIFNFIIPTGEKYKNTQTVNNIYRFLALNNFIKTDYIIAFGGGVVGDISGFVAATYMRGIKLINVPTSLMAQVDSSIGGKNGVNLTEGKNLIGTFYNPHIVICDIALLKSLPYKQFSSGMAEIIKYCIIKKSPLNYLLNDVKNNMQEIITNCVKIKKDFVEEDMFDENRRRILNFGHTVGHAIECIGNYSRFLHGEAVGLGMLLITKLAVNNHLASKNVYNEIFKLLVKFNLPTKANLNIDSVIRKIILDKKSTTDALNIIIVKSIGVPVIYKLPLVKINQYFKDIKLL